MSQEVSQEDRERIAHKRPNASVVRGIQPDAHHSLQVGGSAAARFNCWTREANGVNI